MTDRERFIKTIKDELPPFERVFRALPEDKLDYRPDPKTRTAREIATSMAGESGGFGVFLKTGLLDFAAGPHPSFKTVAEMTAALKQGLENAAKTAAETSESDWDAEARMVEGDKEHWKTTRGGMAWGLLLDLVHHRGQLSAYLRAMGGKVPSIYGPSGDSNG